MSILATSFKIACKNRDVGCDRVLSNSEELEIHEQQCLLCEKCKVKCSFCGNPVGVDERDSHACPPPPAQLQVESINSNNEENVTLNESVVEP